MKKQINSQVIWLTGLSGAGKSTIATYTAGEYYENGEIPCILDGDVIRKELCSDLKFSPEDRKENIRRIASIAKVLLDQGIIPIVAVISPYKEDRQMARDIIGAGRFYEVFVQCPISVCEDRDPKGLYAQVRNGTLKGFTGIDAPYEKPTDSDMIVDTTLIRAKDAGMLIHKYTTGAMDGILQSER